MSWSTTRPTPIEKPGWTTNPALPTPIGSQIWATKFTRKFSVEAAPQIGMAAQARIAASLGLVATPTIGMDAAPHHSAEFALVATPQIGMALPPPIPADFALAAAPSIGMTATERYARDLVIAANPSIGMVAAERYARSFGLVATPDLTFAAQQRVSASFALSTTPTLGFVASKAPVVFDTATLGGSGGATSRSWLHTLKGNCLVVIFTNTTSTAATCTFGGVNIPRVYGPAADGGVFPYTSYISIFAIVSDSLPQGAQTITCTQAGTASAGMAMSFRHAGAIGPVVGDTSSGNVNQTATPGVGGAAVAGYVGGSSNFGLMSPNSAGNYGFTAFVTWATGAGWGLDTGAGINFAATHSGAKTGAVVPILPAT